MVGRVEKVDGPNHHYDALHNIEMESKPSIGIIIDLQCTVCLLKSARRVNCMKNSYFANVMQLHTLAILRSLQVEHQSPYPILIHVHCLSIQSFVRNRLIKGIRISQKSGRTSKRPVDWDGQRVLSITLSSDEWKTDAHNQTMEIETQFDRDWATLQRAYRRVRTFATRWQHSEKHAKPIILTIAILLLCWSNLHHDSRILRETHQEMLHDNSMFQVANIDMVQLAKDYQEPTSSLHNHNITAAVCFKTLFGDIDLGIVIQWAAYNRLLGFDHIFMWYRPEMESIDRFDELKALPFVTLTINTEGKRSNYFNQWETEIKCLKDFANDYTWAMLADIDEYIWFSDAVGIKDFLQQQDAMTYISLGKQMYTLDHRTDAAYVNHKIATHRNDHFAVSKYPFHMKHFCYHQQRIGDPMCPTWRGRSKVIVRPKIHQRIDTHGTIHHPDPTKGTIHLSPESAHFMEWPDIFAAHNVTKRSATEFYVQTFEDVHIHNLKRAFRPVDDAGNYLVEMDSGLTKWFESVIRRGVRPILDRR